MSNEQGKRTVQDYLKLPYHIVLVWDEDDEGNSGYVAEIQELPGCLSQGDIPNDAVESVRGAMAGWITCALQDGKEIPLPEPPRPARSGSR